jgi:hypothetical protein
MQQPEFEQIPSGDFTIAAIAQCYPDLFADVTDVFMLLDPVDITDQAIRDRHQQTSLTVLVQILDDLFGEIPYPYAEEDVPLPLDQMQMDSLTAEVESYLQDGGE